MTTVRRSTVSDHDAIRDLVTRAFAAAHHSAPPIEPGGPPGEVALVEWLREDMGYDQAFDLVAVGGDGERNRHDPAGVVGHIMATWGEVEGTPVLGIGPLSVDPDRQGRGVGSTLMQKVLDAARARGEGVVVLLGDPGYYGRFGFTPASRWGIEAPDPQWGEFFQACALGSEIPTGTYTYAEPYSRLG